LFLLWVSLGAVLDSGAGSGAVAAGEADALELLSGCGAFD